MKKENSELFKTPKRYFRSTSLERDWEDPSALESYTITPLVQDSLHKITQGLRNKSSLRAWRITGDYGSGKSSFALFLANIFDKRIRNLSPTVKTKIQESNEALLKASQPRLIPVLVTGQRAPLPNVLLTSLLTVLRSEGVSTKFLNQLQEFSLSTEVKQDEKVFEWVKKAQTHIVSAKKADGLAIIIDEAGKFFEYAAHRADTQDIYLFQLLAEYASRSGNNPFFIISILHQGVTSYAEGLPRARQKEWEKVAGRFDEISWYHPLEQVVTLIAGCLNLDQKLISAKQRSIQQNEMAEVIKLGWYGGDLDKSYLTKTSLGIYPLHPTTIPILVKLFSSIGQNERSLYSFLLGNDSFSLIDFVSKNGNNKQYRLHDLFDYARATFGPKLSTVNYYWKSIESTVQSFTGKSASELEILKTIAIINLVNSDHLIASSAVLQLSVSNESASKDIQKLQKGHVIHNRGIAGGFCVWPNSSVDLEDCYSRAKKAVGSSLNDLKSLLKGKLTTRPIVARRYYIETGNLRFFEVRYVDIEELGRKDNLTFNGDGLIIIPICINDSEVQRAGKLAKSSNFLNNNSIVLGISQSLQEMAPVLDEIRRWEWIERSVGELRQDKYAREEVSRQLQVHNEELQQHLQSAIGIANHFLESNIVWHYKGKKLPNLRTGKDLMGLLTDICYETYTLSPTIKNELINRRSISSAAASARMRLCERLFEKYDEAFLGMDPTSHPPEMSMYLSVLREAGLHRQDEKTGEWDVVLPEKSYDDVHCKILPIMNFIHQLLAQNADKRMLVQLLNAEVRKPPYGLMDGMTPLLLACFTVIHEREVALYEDGSFIPRISGSVFMRLVKAPETFEIQYYQISTVRSALFHRLVQKLGITQVQKDLEILDVVKPLINFITSLPEYVINTSGIEPTTQAVRNIFKSSSDPVKLLFHDLPIATAVSPITETDNVSAKVVDIFAEKLKGALDEMRGAYPALLQKMKKDLEKEFGITKNFQIFRHDVAERARKLINFVTEIKLKSFCNRLADSNLPEDQWIESIGNLVCSMPPNKWRDKDVHKFSQDLHVLVQHFLRVEATTYNALRENMQGTAVRVALTKANGEERDQVIFLSEDEVANITSLEDRLREILTDKGQAAMAATSNILWELMTQKN